MAKWAGLQQFKVVKSAGKHVKEIVIWDQISKCTKEKCPVFEECVFIKEGKCSLEAEYIEALCKMIYGLEREERLTNATMFMAGLHIVPLYQHLFKFKLIEIGLEGESVIKAGAKTKMHPVYKEIRDTINTIMRSWKDIGILDKESIPLPDMPTVGGSYYEVINYGDSDDPEQ